MYVWPLSVFRTVPRNWLFLPRYATVGHVKETYGSRLQAARKRAGYRSQQALGDRLGVSSKTIRNYETDVYLPPADMRDELRRVLGHFDAEGDAVEVAIANSELVDWRQDAVRSVYRRNLSEQREGRAG